MQDLSIENEFTGFDQGRSLSQKGIPVFHKQRDIDVFSGASSRYAVRIGQQQIARFGACEQNLRIRRRGMQVRNQAAQPNEVRLCA
jgi:hypothetical protein